MHIFVCHSDSIIIFFVAERSAFVVMMSPLLQLVFPIPRATCHVLVIHTKHVEVSLQSVSFKLVLQVSTTKQIAN